MSRNFHQSGQQVSFLGWDRVSQSAFLALGNIAESGQDFQDPLILEQDFPFDRGSDMHHVDELFAAMKSVLDTLGINVPDTLFKSLKSDISNNSANITRVHYFGKDPDIVNGDPFLAGVFAKNITKNNQEKVDE